MNLNNSDTYFDKKNRRVIAVDLDATLTNGENSYIVEPTPQQKHIDIIRALYKKGYIIIIHTARWWEYSCETVAWLIKNRVPFHGIMMGKMGADAYIDDKNGSFDELEKLL
jgi:hypothetical protein